MRPNGNGGERWKEFDDTGLCIRLDITPQSDGRTDGRTELVKQYRALYTVCVLRVSKLRIV